MADLFWAFLFNDVKLSHLLCIRFVCLGVLVVSFTFLGAENEARALYMQIFTH